MGNKENSKEEKTVENKEAAGKKNIRNTAVNKKSEKPRAVIYMGPSVPNNELIFGKIYKELPEYSRNFVLKNPIIGKLVIDIDRVAEFNRRVSVKGTEENRLYSEAERIIKEGVIL